LRITTFLLLACCFLLNGQSFENSRVAKGFEYFYNLEYEQSLAEFRRLMAEDPKDPDLQNHVAQAVLYREMLRGGALESELVSGNNSFIKREKLNTSSEAQKEFDTCIATAMQLAQDRIAKNENDADAWYALGVSHGLRANYDFLVRKAWMDSLKDATASRKAHNRVVEIDPNRIDAQLIQGLHDYIVGSLPFHMKLLGFLAGFHGDRSAGVKTLQLVAEKGKMNRFDAEVLLAVIYRREKKPEQALPLLNGLIARFPRNYLFRLETVQMYSDLGKKEDALVALNNIEQQKRAGSPGFVSLPIEKVHYYRGNLLFWYRDIDVALSEMQKATSKASNLDLHTAVMAWMRLGQLNDMKGRRGEAINAYKQAIAVAPESDAGKESRQYLSSPYKRV
jgi:tetratricopeptide (TPR) repeat protein